LSLSSLSLRQRLRRNLNLSGGLNFGVHYKLQVTGVSVTGPDAAMFTVFAIAPDGSKVTATFPIMLQSGRPQYFALQFCPTRYGSVSATRQISKDKQGSPGLLSASLPVTTMAPPAPTMLYAAIQRSY